MRDEKGMAYIYAQNEDDAYMAYGFVTAQDRLFQMELTKLFASGRLCELAGEKARAIDIRNRTIGFYRHAQRQAAILAPEMRQMFQSYLNGVNAYIKDRTKTHHLEFKLAGIKPEPWTIEDSLCMTFYLGWGLSANLKTEIVAQMLSQKIGLEKAKQLYPVNINPDDPNTDQNDTYAATPPPPPISFMLDASLLGFMEHNPFEIGSNNWVTSSQLSTGGKPIVANDPHLDSRMLPGFWYPCGLITPETRIVGAGPPGQPSMFVFRKETIKIKLTKRGPVVSDIWPSLKTDKVVTLRFAPFESMQPQIGMDKLQKARSVSEAREAIGQLNLAMFNFVFADTQGNIGWQTSGKLPVRSQGDGTLPYQVVDDKDNWTGWIPYADMPHAINPDKGWLGTCNHYTVDHDYPYYYTSHAAPSYRYRRLIQLMQAPGKKSVSDHWAYQQDTLNLMAQEIAPLMAAALSAYPETKAMGDILAEWDHHDDINQPGPTIFHTVYHHFALLTFSDELGDDVTRTMLANWYFWEERLHKMILGNNSDWFDDTTTNDIRETRDDLFYKAALIAGDELKTKLGGKQSKWHWGKVHTIEYVSPIRRKGFGTAFLGGGEHPAEGSAETLLRNYHEFNKPFKVITSDSLRMVADLSDTEKVLAILPGGIRGRVFHPHYKDQIKAFNSGEKVYWWFSDKAIGNHAKSTLVLNP